MRTRGLWVLATLLPFGFGSWAAFAYAARRVGRRSWYVWAAAYAVLCLGGFAIVGSTDTDSAASDIGLAMVVLPWFFSIGHALVVRPDYVKRLEAGGFEDRLEAARDRLEARRRGRELAVENPSLARELGIGRPDRPGAEHLGLVDLNNAPVDAIERLPGINHALACGIERSREQMGGWRSVEEFGMTLELPGDLVERLRDDVVFLPRD